MRTFFYTLFLLFAGVIFSQCGPSKPVSEQAEGFDSALASELGADDYGMKTYVMAFLSRGEQQGLDSLERSRLQRAHLDNITHLAEEGKLVLAGPFLDNGKLRGIYIFDVQSLDEARALTETDPAIQAGTLQMDLRLWYGSAALMKVNEMHTRLAKKGI